MRRWAVAAGLGSCLFCSRLGSSVYSRPPRVSSAWALGAKRLSLDYRLSLSLSLSLSRFSEASARHAQAPAGGPAGSCLVVSCFSRRSSFSIRTGRARGSGRGPPAFHQRRGLWDTVRRAISQFDPCFSSFMGRYYGKGKWYILDTDAPPVIEVAAPPVCADSVRRARSPQGRSRMCRSIPVSSVNHRGQFFLNWTCEVMSEYLNKQEFSDVSFVVEGATLLGIVTSSRKSLRGSE